MRPETHPRFGVGLSVALLSSMAFGLSGPFAAGLLAAGWSPLGAVLPRVLIGGLVLLIPALIALRGRWRLLRRGWRTMVAYGTLAIAVTQLSYFNAVQHLQVAQALLIEYLAPVALVGYLWVRRGERPTVRTLAGAALAIAGLALVLQVVGSAGSLDPRGLAWGLGAMIGNAAYFLFSSDDSSGLPPIVLAAGGLLIGAGLFGVFAVLGLLPFETAATAVIYAGVAVPWWVAVLALAVVTAALSYVTGIFGARLLGARLASFVGSAEVLFAVIFSALLVGQILTGQQVVGGLLVLAGVVLVKLGEDRITELSSTTRPKAEPAGEAPVPAPF